MPQMQDAPVTKENDVRETPSTLFDPLNSEFRFDLDACADHENTQCPLYFTEQGLFCQPVHSGIWGRRTVSAINNARKLDDANGLTGSWKGRRVWCNPPFSQLGTWCNKAWFSEADLVVMLVPCNRTEQGWWHEYVEPYRDNAGCTGTDILRTRNLKGRFHFLEDGQPVWRKNKDGSIWLNEKGQKERSSPKFGVTLLIWRFGT